MSEYWKSTPKYWCKHCSTYVKDTPFERKQHETTAKHQNNLKRVLRDIQNDHERGQRETARAKAEVERLNRITGTGFSSTAPSVSTHTFRKDRQDPRTADDQKRQWQQLADMGIQVPDHIRSEMAMVGTWKATKQSEPEVQSEESLSKGIRKRKLEHVDDEEDQPELSKPLSSSTIWGKSIKKAPAHVGDDLDALLSSDLALKTEPKIEHVNETSKRESLEAASDENTSKGDLDQQQLPPSEGAQNVVRSLTDLPTTALVKLESPDDTHHQSQSVVTNPQDIGPGPIFKKRKPKANSARQ